MSETGTQGKGATTRQQLLDATVELMAELGIDRFCSTELSKFGQRVAQDAQSTLH